MQSSGSTLDAQGCACVTETDTGVRQHQLPKLQPALVVYHLHPTCYPYGILHPHASQPPSQFLALFVVPLFPMHVERAHVLRS